MDMNVSTLPAGSSWCLAAITQHYPTDSTATTKIHQGLCDVYNYKRLREQKPVT